MSTLQRGEPAEQPDRSDGYVAHGSGFSATQRGALKDLGYDCFSGWFFFSPSSWNNMSSVPYQRGGFLTFSWGHVLHALGTARWHVWALEGSRALLEQRHRTGQGGGSWTWCRPAHTALWAWCLERSISKTTAVFWFRGNRWFSPPKQSLDVKEQLCLVGSWGPRPSGEAGSCYLMV